jgi:hypothetical protein
MHVIPVDFASLELDIRTFLSINDKSLLFFFFPFSFGFTDRVAYRKTRSGELTKVKKD